MIAEKGIMDISFEIKINEFEGRLQLTNRPA